MLRDRLRENVVVQANFILVLGNVIERRWAPEWWEDFAKVDRVEFEAEVDTLLRAWASLRTVVALEDGDGP